MTPITQAAEARAQMVEQVVAALALVSWPGPLKGASADSLLRADLALDSLGHQALACELDEAFGLAIPDDDVAAWQTVADVADTLTRLRGAGARLHGTD